MLAGLPRRLAAIGYDSLLLGGVLFAATLLVYGLATGASALATGLAMLLALRFLVGVGLGAELPVASTLVSELSPTRIRGRMVVALESFWAVGWLLAALIGFFVVPRVDQGWRWAFALGVVPALWAVVRVARSSAVRPRPRSMRLPMSIIVQPTSRTMDSAATPDRASMPASV